ncbi:MAG: methylated-DNA--[protein]-cysteine S-methyltransferase [Beijerinckiaceae bacterium]
MSVPAFALARLKTPTGTMLLVFDDEANLRAADWEDYASRMHRLLRLHYGAECIDKLASGRAPPPLRDRLDAYFAGELGAINAIAVATGGTPFQRKLWAALRAIPAGATTTYGALAARIGAPAAIRAVGAANGANPIGIVVPCHRVIGADARLTGYGGGLDRKRWLLAHEGAAFRM